MTDRTFVSASLHTPPGRGGIAVIYLDGSDWREVLGAAFRPLAAHAGAVGGALQLGKLIDGDEIIDEAIVCLTPRGAEVNIHGGPVVAARAMELFARCDARIETAPTTSADTLTLAHRNMNNPAIGREMLDALPAAQSATAVAAITHQWSAGLSELAGGILDGLCDRSDAKKFRKAADGLDTMRKILEPVEIVIAGAPNAGKSTLANAIVGRQVSIVHDSAGTTRDWVRETALLDGVPIYLTDTAGLWDVPTAGAAGKIDVEAVRRARLRVDKADLVLLLETGEAFDAPPWLHARDVLKVAGKCDLPRPGIPAGVQISALTGEGMEALRHEILRKLGLDEFDPHLARAFTFRQAELLNEIADALRRNDTPSARSAAERLLGC